MEALGVAIVGCGLIGAKRAAVIASPEFESCRLLWCVDVDEGRAQGLARNHAGARASTDLKQVLADPAVGIVIVATPNYLLSELTISAVQAGKDVIVEKPAARTLSEIRECLSVVKSTDRIVRVGFNHRYHPAFQKARSIVDSGALGPLMFVRARYGHGGRLGYEKEWRAKPELSGGGELIDQGVHVIDLSRWFLGEFVSVAGHAQTCFWDMPVDDNAFLTLQTAERQTAFLHVSCSEWKNLFSFELYGRLGKLQVDGLGGSYGVERLTYYRMLPEMGPPETTSWEFPQRDRSWELEFAEFLEDVRLRRQPHAGLDAAYAALQVVDEIYTRSGYDNHT